METNTQQLIEHATDLYNGDEEMALRWLKTPNLAFDGATPLEILSSEVGSGVIDGLISQLELGILPAHQYAPQLFRG